MVEAALTRLVGVAVALVGAYWLVAHLAPLTAAPLTRLVLP